MAPEGAGIAGGACGYPDFFEGDEDRVGGGGDALYVTLLSSRSGSSG